MILVLVSLIIAAFISQVKGAAVCPDGYYGPRCSRRCLGHCSNNLCYLVYTGNAVKCREGCEKGWRGPACSIKCKYPCLECGRYGGECIGPCRDGYYGSECSKRCPGNCRKCDQDSGFCEHSCIDGYYGDFCSNSCACDRCDRETGACLSNGTLDKPGPWDTSKEARRLSEKYSKGSRTDSSSSDDAAKMESDVSEAFIFEVVVAKPIETDEQRCHSYTEEMLVTCGALLTAVIIFALIIYRRKKRLESFPSQDGGKHTVSLIDKDDDADYMAKKRLESCHSQDDEKHTVSLIDEENDAECTVNVSDKEILIQK